MNISEAKLTKITFHTPPPGVKLSYLERLPPVLLLSLIRYLNEDEWGVFRLMESSRYLYTELGTGTSQLWRKLCHEQFNFQPDPYQRLIEEFSQDQRIQGIAWRNLYRRRWRGHEPWKVLSSTRIRFSKITDIIPCSNRNIIVVLDRRTTEIVSPAGEWKSLIHADYRVTGAQLLSNGNLLTRSSDRIARVFPVASGDLVKEIGAFPADITAMRAYPTGNMIFGFSDGAICLVSDVIAFSTIKCYAEPIVDIAICQNGQMVSASRDQMSIHSPTGAIITQLDPHLEQYHSISGIAVTSMGLILSITDKGTIGVFTAEGLFLNGYSDKYATLLHFGLLPDDQIVYATRTRTEIHSMEHKRSAVLAIHTFDSQSRITRVATFPNGDIVTATNYGTICVRTRDVAKLVPQSETSYCFVS